MATELQSLKSNPIFQLSLASKELFHSNFLFWLSQDDNLRPYFEDVIDSLCGKGNEINWEETFGKDKNRYNYVVLREYKNFDLCICKKKIIKSRKKQPENNNSASSQKEDETFKEDEKIAGEIVFVLENKFKSIATAAQLDGYTNKVLGINLPYYKSAVCKKWKKKDVELKDSLSNQFENNKPKLVLLTLAKNFTEKKSIEKLKEKKYILDPKGQYLDNDKEVTLNGYEWKVVNYCGFANKLNELIDSEKNPNFSYQLIQHYCEFIQTFSKYINSKLNDINKEDGIITWNQLYNDSDFKSIRCSDIWQKMAMHKIAQELMGKVKNKIQGFVIDTDSTDKHCRECSDKDNFDKTIFIGVQYFHSLALLEIKYRIGDDCMFVIQQQGNSLCAGIDYLTKKQKKLKKDFLSTYIVKDSKIQIVDTPHSYKNEKGVFFYQNIILKSQSKDGPTIEETINFMVKCLINVINPSTGNSNDTVALKDKESGSLK